LSSWAGESRRSAWESKPSALIDSFAALSTGKPPQRDRWDDNGTCDTEEPVQGGETANFRIVERFEFLDSALEVLDESLAIGLLRARVAICSGLVGHVAPRKGHWKVAPSYDDGG
ncbi:MAG: hypothetical protein ACC649_07620, partial [Myxococcota bacterium]